MELVRKIKTIIKSKPVIEGAGVHLNRVFGHEQAPDLDPFLLLDDFHSDDPEKYIKGFPWHPHRGIETITYLLEGSVTHGDSMQNKGVISPGDIQWMTAGKGIVHQEMPKGNDAGKLWGFQLWANLPAASKMMPPRYQEIKSEQIPEVVLESGVKIRVICGEVNNTGGPVKDIVIDPQYLDVSMPPDTEFEHDIHPRHTVLAYVFSGSADFGPGLGDPISSGSMAVFGNGQKTAARTQSDPARFLLISGNPLKEPVAWHGPIVMNTQEELETAFRQYREGTFLTP